MKLRLLPEALVRIETARSWWVENREKAPGLFDEELAEALDRILSSPTTGQLLALERGRSVRRTLLPKTALHLYYDVNADEVTILTLWGAVRGSAPDLR